MRNAFNHLVELMNRYDLYQKDDEVGDALNDLEKVITELEKRIECVTRCNKEIDEVVFSFVDAFEDRGETEQTLTYGQFEVLLRGIHDIDIALDLKETECVDNNWYGLFEEPKEENVPRETIILIPKDSIVEWKETIQYYNVQGDTKARVTEDYTTKHESDDKYLMVEWLGETANGQQNGGYERDCFKEEFEIPKPPTELCKTPQTHEFVKDIIAKLKVIDIDGETMQYILKEVGMEEQMLKQLIMNSTESNTKDLLEERRILSNQGKLV
jgi:hypothetical protein